MKENTVRSLPGIPVLLVASFAIGAGLYQLILGAAHAYPLFALAAVLLIVAGIVVAVGLYKLEPNQSAVLSLFGRYAGTVREDGLRWNNPFYAHHLQEQIAERLGKAGVRVIKARISHLAYAPEIAQAMLQRQQANAVIAARTRIVAGAVGMVEMALSELEKHGTVRLDEERKAQMVSNLLVVLCGDRGPQPVVNAGSLY